MRPTGVPSEFQDHLAERLYWHLQDHPLYDEVGHPKVGWHGLTIMDKIPYIVSHIKGVFKYEVYKNQRSAVKAWDHVCIKFEKWYTENNND